MFVEVAGCLALLIAFKVVSAWLKAFKYYRCARSPLAWTVGSVVDSQLADWLAAFTFAVQLCPWLLRDGLLWPGQAGADPQPVEQAANQQLEGQGKE
jgi:hypothetical protein